MTSHLRVAAYAAIALFGFTSVGCQQQAANNAVAPTGDATNTASTTAATAPTAAATASNLPAVCNAYIDALQRCIAARPDMAVGLRRQLDSARHELDVMANPADREHVCTTYQTNFSHYATAMNCS